MKTRLFKLLLVLVLVVAVSNVSVLAEQAIERTSYLPQFESVKANIQALEQNLAKTGQLADVLKKGNDELSEAIKQYSQNHSTETKDRIYNLLGDLATKSVGQIGDIVAKKDEMKDGTTEILYKMDSIKVTLKDRQKKFITYIENTNKEADKVKEELRQMARKIKSDPNNAELRKQFRSKLFALRGLDSRYKTYQAHQRLNEKFGKQVELAQQFFQRLANSTDQLISNLEEQKEFLVMRISLLKDAAEMESWLRGGSEDGGSAFAMMKRISELSQALEKFNTATDVLVEMEDIGALVENLPDGSEVFGIDGSTGGKGGNFEDKYVEYFLKN